MASCWAREWEPEAAGRGFLPREITFSRDHLRSSVANFTRVCMTAFASKCVYYFTRWGHRNWGLSGCNYCWHAMVGGTGEGVRVEGGAGVRGATPYCHETNQFHCIWSFTCKNAALTLDLGLSASAAGSCCVFTLAVRQPPVLASYIEI